MATILILYYRAVLLHRPQKDGQVATMMRTAVSTDHHRCLLHRAAALCISADGAVDFFSNRQK